MQTFADSFALTSDAQAILERLVESCEEFGHLSAQRILCVSSQRTPMLHGAPCQAFIAKPTVQGPLKPLVDWMIAVLARPVFPDADPDYVIVFDAVLWPDLDATRQERLVYHELRHVEAKVDEDTGIPKRSPLDQRILTKLVPHHYEFFDDEVRRYGPTVCDLEAAAIAIADGHRAAQRRCLRIA